MKTEEAINSRRSIREFSNKPVKFGLIMEAIDSANQSPFAGNINNLKYLIVEKQENKKYIAEFSQQLWINESSWIIIVCSESEKLEQLYGEKGIIYGKQQAGAAIENMLIKITDIGLGACWVGAFSEKEIKSHFKIPNKWTVEAIIPIGYPKNKKNLEKRKATLESTIFWEKWDQKNKPIKYPYKDPSTN